MWKELEKEGCCTFVGVVDSRLDVLECAKKSFNVATSPNVDSFLSGSVDAVDIVTPTDTHFRISAECLNARKHVLVEKPLTASYDEAEELVQIAREQSKILMVGHIFRYNPAVQKIRVYTKRRTRRNLLPIRALHGNKRSKA